MIWEKENSGIGCVKNCLGSTDFPLRDKAGILGNSIAEMKASALLSDIAVITVLLLQSEHMFGIIIL